MYGQMNKIIRTYPYISRIVNYGELLQTQMIYLQSSLRDVWAYQRDNRNTSLHLNGSEASIKVTTCTNDKL